MHLCIPIADARQGGVHSFFRNFRKWLAARGIATTEDPGGNWDVLVANSWVVREHIVARAKRGHPAGRVLHRIDGSAVDYGRDAAADVQQALVNLLADVTVFQSAYGRTVTRSRAVIAQDGPVIHNAVDIDLFRPDGERVPLAGRVRVAHVAFSTNARKGAAAVFGLARRVPDVTFVMIGRYEAPPALPNVVLLGYAGWESLPAVLRSCHALVFLGENETCPNVVLEALASGLPVLYRASGGTPEIVGDCGVAVDAESFPVALRSVMDHHPALAGAARARAVDRFAPDAIFPRYLAAAEVAIRRPLPCAAAYARTLLRLRASPATVARWLAKRTLDRRPAAEAVV